MLPRDGAFSSVRLFYSKSYIKIFVAAMPVNDKMGKEGVGGKWRDDEAARSCCHRNMPWRGGSIFGSLADRSPVIKSLSERHQPMFIVILQQSE